MAKGRQDTNNGGRANERLTIAEAAALLGVHPNTVRNRVKAGVYDAEKVVTENGQTWMIKRNSILNNPLPKDSQQAPSQRQTQAEVHATHLTQDLLRSFVEDLGRVREELGAERVRREQAEQERDRLARELEALREARDDPQSIEAAKSTPTDREEGGTPPEPKRQGLVLAGPPRYEETASPRLTMFTSLVPLPREYKREGDQVTNIGMTRRRKIVRYGSYFLGIVLTAGVGYLSWFLSLGVPFTSTSTTEAPLEPSLEGGLQSLALRLVVTVAFGIYVGLKDGKVPIWGRFSLIGVLAGILSMAAVYSLPLSTRFEWLVVSYFFGTWLMFFSGVLLGKAVQFAAERERWATQNGVIFEHKRPEAPERGTARTTAIVGLIGVLGAALLQVFGQAISALLGGGT